MVPDSADMVDKSNNPFFSSSFFKRTASAIIAIFLSTSFISLGFPYCDVLAFFLTFAMLHELIQITGNRKNIYFILVIVCLQMLLALYQNFIPVFLKAPLFVISFLITTFSFIKLRYSLHCVILVLGSIYIGLSMLFFIRLTHINPSCVNFIYWVLILVWTNDTAAFFIGKKFGKNKLAPNISPNKTWEGFVGALVVGTLIATLLATLLKVKPFFNIPISITALILGLFAHFGDLLESFIKRLCHVKDTGSLIPGHGGVLDRLDSLLLVNIVVYIFLSLGFLNIN